MIIHKFVAPKYPPLLALVTCVVRKHLVLKPMGTINQLLTRPGAQRLSPIDV